MLNARPIETSIFSATPFTLITLPYEKLNSDKYAGQLRELADGSTTDMLVAMDMDRMLGLVIGSAYLGSIKKLMFTVLPFCIKLRYRNAIPFFA